MVTQQYGENLANAIYRLENAPVIAATNTYRDIPDWDISEDIQTVIEAAGRYLDLM